ncbi:MAG: FtsX-like permease family protein, partial [Gemmatimonadetes bacterium]|nr:FtsX-like permease family protein [Gemmatimonadota bacterium]NIR81579.1 FtsX-like permease family protein [Gemmatimonadota bacterium]NIT90420.1 FtsX-like permease family protein [Gemmatimonadota bacterium]NIU34254.1 FtsX-like permease family protein [Gemmatimonadota bacterium]NIU38382.1 FtsX-like permease family protein [Gemmatimonadota bacterium]
LSLSRDGAERDARRLFVTGRLRENVGHERATEEVAAIGRSLASEHPAANAGWSLWSAPVMESLINDDGWTILTLLVLMVGFVVLIACANVANMLLARGTARAREMAVRTALGAGRGRLVRQLLTESFVVSLAAAGLGLLFSTGLLEALIRISNGQEQVFLMAEIDGRVLGFTLLVSLVAPLIFGLFPALRASDRDASGVLRDGRGADGGRAGKRARGTLVGAQIALAVTLMVVAGLLVRSIYNLQQREMGFDPAGLAVVELDLPENEYPDEESRRQYFERVLEEVEAMPSVRGAAMLSAIPGADFGMRRGLEIEGRPLPEDRARPPVFAVRVSPGTFEVMGVPIVAGRAFSAADGPDGVPVAILSREVADRYWAEQDPIGRRIRVGADEEEWLRIVGVAGDVRSTTDSEEPAPNVYLPYGQNAATASY